MLAAMSSLASLAHEARTVAPAFNGLFYATAATIIPVLFLAIAVQGPLYGDLLKASGATLRRFREHKAGASPRRLVLRLWIGSVLASSAAVAILIVTVGGEIEALLSLNAERAYGDPHAAIAAAVLLTAAAAIGPALAFGRLMVTLYPRRGNGAARHPSQRLTTYTGLSDYPWPSHKLAKWTQKPEASLRQIDLLAAHGRRAPVRGPRSRIGNKSAPTLARALAECP
jgi:hypothetical protein